MPALFTREPSDLPIGVLMRKYLMKKCDPAIDALLFAADRADHYFSQILPSLDAGTIVVTDRYKLSSLAYQSAEGLDPEWVIAINSRVPNADLNIILDLDPPTSLDRKTEEFKTRERDKFERIEFLKTVRSNYKRFGSKLGKTITISSERSIEETQKAIRNAVDSFLMKMKGKTFQ